MKIKEFIDSIRDFSDIIIYGAKTRGAELYSLVESKLPFSDVHIAVTNMVVGEVSFILGSRGQIENVYDIRQCAPIAQKAVIVLAAASKYHNEMEEYARSLGFDNIVKAPDDFYDDLFSAVSKPNSYLIRRNIFLQHQNINLLRLNNLKERIRSNPKYKVKVTFIVTSKAKFQFASVYRAMEKIELFDVALFVYDEFYKSKAFNTQSLSSMRKYADKLEQEGFNVIWGYDENDKTIHIEEHDPDIIFYNVRYSTMFQNSHNLDQVVQNHLSCFIPYGMHVLKKNINYHFNNDELIPAWIQFLDTQAAYDLCAKVSVTSGMNSVLAGWPILDDYISPPHRLKNVNVPKQPPNIIYAPHWSFQHLAIPTTFDIFCNLFLELMDKYHDFHFIFKPHPSLEQEIRVRANRYDDTGITPTAYKEYCEKWENAPNGEIVQDSSFIQRFKNSECLITDSYSFLLAWLPTKKPCIILKNPFDTADIYQRFYDFLHPMIDTYYICESIEQINKTIEDVVINKNDYKYEKRVEQCEKLIHNLGTSGEFIARYVEKKLLK